MKEFKAPTTDREALELALYLTLTAPGDKEMAMAAVIAARISLNMSDEELKTAMEAAELRVSRERDALH